MAQCTHLLGVTGGKVTRNTWFQHDRAAAHFARQVSPPLTMNAGLYGAWPPKSPDLTLMDFFLCSHIKALIYTLQVDSKEDLISCIIKAATIR